MEQFGKRIIRTDTKSFGQLFYRLQPRLYAYCSKYIEDSELAKDIVQECFFNLWNQLSEVTGSYESYLFKAVHNRCISHFRSQKISANYKASVKKRLQETALHPELSYPLTELYLKEIKELLQHCVEKLPEKCRIIFEMSRNQGLKNKEIANDLGLSVRTVDAQLYHALKTIKEDLKDYLIAILLLYSIFEYI